MYTPHKAVVYENLVKLEYERQCDGFRFPDGEPLQMKITAYYATPKSGSAKVRKQKLEGVMRPTKKPDI